MLISNLLLSCRFFCWGEITTALKTAMPLGVLVLPFPASKFWSDVNQTCLLIGMLLKHCCLLKVNGFGLCSRKSVKRKYLQCQKSIAFLICKHFQAFTCLYFDEFNCWRHLLNYVFSGDSFHFVSKDLNPPFLKIYIYIYLFLISVSKQQAIVGLGKKCWFVFSFHASDPALGEIWVVDVDGSHLCRWWH